MRLTAELNRTGYRPSYFLVSGRAMPAFFE